MGNNYLFKKTINKRDTYDNSTNKYQISTIRLLLFLVFGVVLFILILAESVEARNNIYNNSNPTQTPYFVVNGMMQKEVNL